MTVPSLVSIQAVRDEIELNADATSKYSDDTIGSNIRAASWTLERSTGRIFRNETALALTFTTNGATSVPLPGLRTASTVALNSSSLVANEGYYLIPDAQQSGLYTAVQFRPFGRGGGPWYKSYPDWFDRNLDSPYWNRGGSVGSLPNDLVITGDWGYTDALLPEPVRKATKILAAWYTLHARDALMSGVHATLGGSFDISQLPVEVQMFIADWKIGRQAVAL